MAGTNQKTLIDGPFLLLEFAEIKSVAGGEGMGVRDWWEVLCVRYTL